MASPAIASVALTTSTAEEMNPSRRNTMEDCHITHSPGTWGCHDSSMSYIGVYDGHGGRDIVEFLEDSLAENIAQELNQNDDAPMATRLERAFLITDVQSHMMGIGTSGATVAICLIKKQPNQRTVTIHAANAGDARAVLSCTPMTTTNNTISSAKNENKSNTSSTTTRKGRKITPTPAHRLTHDHRADDPNELIRIEKAGGFVTRCRVLGVLAVARSLGDHGMKDFVIGKPFVNTVEIQLPPQEDHNQESYANLLSSSSSVNDYETGGEFVIVACDGLWDVVEDQEAVNLVRSYVKNKIIKPLINEDNTDQRNKIKDIEKKKEEQVAQMLCDEALHRGSTDNVTVIVTWL